MIDTHTHLYLPEFEEEGTAAADRALASGVKFMILPNVDSSTIEPMERLHRARPGSTAMAMGLHPTEVDDGWRDIVDGMETLLRTGGYVAVGEVGIDLYWDKSHKDEQTEAFARQLEIAESLSLPVIIHCREALGETLSVIESVKPTVRLIFHSFTGSAEDVERIRKVCDPMFGINGVVTFKNAGSLREALPAIGTGRLLLETDSPYLAPVPHRGKRNESAYLTHTLQAVAASLGLPAEEVEAATDHNAQTTFRI